MIPKSYADYKLDFHVLSCFLLETSFNRLTSISHLGLINAIAFGVNKETLRRLNWGDMKVGKSQESLKI